MWWVRLAHGTAISTVGVEGPGTRLPSSPLFYHQSFRFGFSLRTYHKLAVVLRLPDQERKCDFARRTAAPGNPRLRFARNETRLLLTTKAPASLLGGNPQCH